MRGSVRWDSHQLAASSSQERLGARQEARRSPVWSVEQVGSRKLAVSLRRVLTPPLPRLFSTTSKSLSLLRRDPTLSPWAQAKTWPQGVEALTFYPSGKSGERAWTHVDTKTATGKGQGTSAQDQPQIPEGEGLLRKAHAQGPSMKGLPKIVAHACLGHPRTPHVPQRLTRTSVTSNSCLAMGPVLWGTRKTGKLRNCSSSLVSMLGTWSHQGAWKLLLPWSTLWGQPCLQLPTGPSRRDACKPRGKTVYFHLCFRHDTWLSN